jgi:hypothetical protein
VPTQREVLRDVMLAAGKYGAWMTLRELGRLTRYGETSISAQSRHLRKANCGGYVLEKRVRKAEVIGAEQHFVCVGIRIDGKARDAVARQLARNTSNKTLNKECGRLAPALTVPTLRRRQLRARPM